jgi:hypothetical protein
MSRKLRRNAWKPNIETVVPKYNTTEKRCQEFLMRWNGFNPHEQSNNLFPDDKDKVLYTIYSCVFLIDHWGMKTAGSITFYLPSNSDKGGFPILGLMVVVYLPLLLQRRSYGPGVLRVI